MKYIIITALSLQLFACAHQVAKPVSPSAKLAKVIDQYQDFETKVSPYNSPKAGSTNAQLPDLSPKKLEQDHQTLKQLFASLNTIEQGQLSQAKRIDYSVLRYRMKNQIDNYINKDHYIPLTAESGFHAYLSFITGMVNFKSEQDYRDYLSRLSQFSSLFRSANELDEGGH